MREKTWEHTKHAELYSFIEKIGVSLKTITYFVFVNEYQIINEKIEIISEIEIVKKIFIFVFNIVLGQTVGAHLPGNNER